MAFTGKATYDAGATLPEAHEDIADVVTAVSPFETPFLNFLGDPMQPARATYHEWMEDALLPDTDALDEALTTAETAVDVDNGSRFRVNDVVRVDGSNETMLVTAIATNTLTVTRAYGDTAAATHSDNAVVQILGTAILEGDEAPTPRFQNRSRAANYTQIFSEQAKVSGSQEATSLVGVASEIDYQVEMRTRELLRYLEKSVISGTQPDATGQGSDTVGRSMDGIIEKISTHAYAADSGTFSGFGLDLTEEMLNLLIREVWEDSNAPIDFVLCNGFQKRKINGFLTPSRRYAPEDQRFTDRVQVYDSDFGELSVVLSRWVPRDTIIVGASSLMQVMPLQGRSFFSKPLAETGDFEARQVIGEYTLEMRNESAHAYLNTLSTS